MSYTRKINPKFIYIIIFAAAALVLGACSAPAEKLNQDGNEAFTEQAYLEALELYQSAQVESPELAEPYFNAANTFYRQGDFPAALEQMQMALQYVDEESLAESSYYNLGNTLFNSQELETAVEAYTQTLLLNPDDQDAKHNLELALQQQEQQEQQEQQQEQNQEQNEESQDQSQEQGGEGQESEDQENEDSQDGENQEENNEDQEGDQSQNNEQQDGEQESEPQDGSGENQADQQPSQTPQPGQRMTEEQARQLLAAIADDMQTLQEELGQYLFARQQPPTQDW
jgi:Ca-activated chloride channel family protein